MGGVLVKASSGAPENLAGSLALAPTTTASGTFSRVGIRGKARGSLGRSAPAVSLLTMPCCSAILGIFLLDLRGCLAPKMRLPRLEKDSWVIKSSSSNLSVGIVVEITGESWGSGIGDNLPKLGDLGDLGADSSCPFCPFSG